MIKFIAVDLDGTLLNSQKQVDEQTIVALKKADQMGIKVVPASGRPLPGVLPYLKKLGLSGHDNYAIVFNGGLIQRLDGEIILNNEMNYNDFRELLRVQKLSKSNLHFVRERHFYTLDRDFSMMMSRISFMSGMPFKVRNFNEIMRNFTFLKCEYTGSKEEMDQLGAKFPAEFKQKYNVARSHPQIWEVNGKGASKGNAIHDLAHRLGIADNEVMIFGDQGNDNTMFSKPDFFKVAMGNAIDAIKNKADFVTKSNDESGIAYALDQLVFK